MAYVYPYIIHSKYTISKTISKIVIVISKTTKKKETIKKNFKQYFMFFTWLMQNIK